MPTPVEIGFEANGEQSVKRAWETVAKGCEDAIRSLAKLTPESLKADAAQRALGNSAEKWLKAISTPMQDYLGDVEELQKLLTAGALSQQQYAAAVELAKKKLEAQNTEIDELAQKAEKLRAALVTPQQRYQQELAEANELLQAQKLTQEEYAAVIERSKRNLDAQDASLQKNLADAAKIRSSMVTPMDEYRTAVSRANQLLQAGTISEAEYAYAVDQAKSALDAKDESLQKSLRDAQRIRQAAVTPEQAHAEAIRAADDLLRKKLITQKEYDLELQRQNRLLRESKSAEQEFLTAGQQAHRNIQNSIEGTALRLMGLQTIYYGVVSVLQDVVQLNIKFSEGIQSAVDLLAEQELKLQIQGGMLPAEVEAQMPQIQAALQATPVVDVGKAIAIQTQTASSGFKPEDVATGAALDATLQLMAATNEFGPRAADPKQSMQAISMYLKGSQGEAPSAEMIKKTGGKLATIFKESDVQFQDLEQLAKKAAGLTQSGITESEQLAAFSVVRDVFGAEKGATGLAGFVTRTATAAANKERVQALKKAKLKPTEVDIAKGGDRLIPTLEKMSAAMQRMTPEQQTIFLNEMYGEEVQNQAAFLLKPENIQKLKDRIAAQEANTILEDNVNTFRGSRFARNQGIANAKVFAEREIDRQRGGTTWKELRDYADAMRAQKQANGDITGTRRVLGAYADSWFTWAQEGLGLAPTQTIEAAHANGIKGDPKSALEQAFQANNAGKAIVAERTRAAANPPAGPAAGAELAPILKQIERNTAKPPVVVKRTVNQPTKARPSEANAAKVGR